MIHLIYTYLIINSFIAGYFFNENDRWESRKYAIGFSILCLVFGGLILLTYPLFLLFTPILGWFYKEISFQYRFYCTDFWDKILLDDNYSEEYETREEKLKRSEQLVKNASKQVKRHNRLIEKKYGNN
jgi:hypothetical protein